MTPEELRERVRIATELVVADDGSLVSESEYHHRLENLYDDAVVEVDEDGCTHYRDASLDPTDPTDDFTESVFLREDIPTSLCEQAIATNTPPEDIISDPDAEAERYNAFSAAVGQEFERQLEEEDDPFPLEFPPDTNR